MESGRCHIATEGVTCQGNTGKPHLCGNRQIRRIGLISLWELVSSMSKPLAKQLQEILSLWMVILQVAMEMGG